MHKTEFKQYLWEHVVSDYKKFISKREMEEIVDLDVFHLKNTGLVEFFNDRNGNYLKLCPKDMYSNFLQYQLTLTK